MVCKKCEEKGKLGSIIVPDKWKEGALNTTLGAGRAVNPNMLINKKSKLIQCVLCLFVPNLIRNAMTRKDKTATHKCKICKANVSSSSAHYCQACAYKKGICAMCGVKILDTKFYRQTSV